MNEKFDEAIRQALTPSEEADFRLNRKIINQIKERETMIGKKKMKLSAAAMIAALVLCAGSATAYAAWKYLSPSEVAGNASDLRLADAFLSEQALVINETQSYGGYRVTLLGIISGEELPEYPRHADGSLAADRTYAAIAIENADGSPMPETSEADYDLPEFFASPLIGGYDPACLNLAGMSGNYTDMTENGILYRLLECDNVEIFADHNLYLCVSQGTFYDTKAYHYDNFTGEISRDADYEGLNALFALPADSAKADPEKAAEYLARFGIPESDYSAEKLNPALNEPFEVEAAPDNAWGAEIAEYALQFVGNPYVWNGDSLTEGTDCSGFTQGVFAHFEISLPHDSRRQREAGIPVDGLEYAEPGDLIFYDTPSHVAIYLGEGMIVHAMPELGICISEADFDDVAEIRRVER
ncbi:MAG: NlpC/P60 family protein [Roseburia sp.]|nr:NlpC/P60 family protein [Roseburia sp.]MCM1097350.1 NlpC/P60 family protein [Ruminococcus flavefaciens]